jgi:phosphoglycerol transferase MdoB-like AlkP superfamily enzyme
VHIRAILRFLLLLLLSMSVLRIAFVLENASFFKNFPAQLFFIGAYFDLVTLALLTLPLLLLLNPLNLLGGAKFQKWLTIGIKAYLVFIAFFVLVLNCWDIAYFAYTQKRSGFSYFLHLLTGTETSSLAGEFLLEFWYLPLLFIGLCLLFWKYLRVISPFQGNTTPKAALLPFLIALPSLIILARGGLQLRPIGIVDATAMSSLEQAPVVLNTAFTVLKTANDQQQAIVQYIPEAQLATFLHQRSTDQIDHLPKKTNVVILILESFGTNYAGPNSPDSYTPFLDTLLKKSLFFDYAIANGRTSMDAVPAILAGMPSWLPESYILSPYCSNQIHSLPQILKRYGYATSFFHGAKEGSMGFKSFTKALGINDYYGLESYPNKEHFDGNWGVWDHHMMAYFGRKLSTVKQPFMSALFTLSSHHPYQIPKAFETKVQKGPEPLCKTISYTDLSLRSFFTRYAKEKWFQNTLFVITADHVGPTRQQRFQTLDWRYRIPVAFYHPRLTVPKPKKGVVFQQIDILPTLLDLLGFERPNFALGSSCYDAQQSQKMVYDNGNLLSFIYNGTNLVPIAWTPGVQRKYTPDQYAVSQKIKGLYQYYMNSLIANKCSDQTIK